jgi:flagellar basal-body rod protein FlgB
MNLDAYLGVHPKALQLFGQRTSLLANNIANADTPGYKAQDLDFRSVLSATGGGSTKLSLAATQSGQANPTAADPASSALPLKYRVPLGPSLDGNTVDVPLEQAAFAENTVRYQSALTFLQDKFRTLMTAITGQ